MTEKSLETPESLEFLFELYELLKDEFEQALKQRVLDRKFIDERVAAFAEYNREQGLRISDPAYKTVLGLEDGKGRIVFGPKNQNYCKKGGAPIAPLPPHLQGPHVTLFGPPDNAKMAINAMNAYHRKMPNEPAIVGELLSQLDASPFWGADDEDSKTPIHEDLVDAGVNLTACFEGTLEFQENGKDYALEKTKLSQPIKRFPGLALSCTFLKHGGKSVPLHLYDFALHLFSNHHNPKALTFYVPKLENEEEAKYIHSMVRHAENLIRKKHASYKLGTVRLMIVLENPRAILRTHEIMDALYPYFAGASLGWHDYLASTARLFKEDPQYRIPVKADPNIVIKYIKASHDLLTEVVGSRGGVKVGGMYGYLPVAGNAESLQVSLRGFFKDVITQLKRGLNGFWVAHPDFMRLGLAIVQAHRTKKLPQLIEAVLEPRYRKEILDWVNAKDIDGLSTGDAGYVRSLIVADIEESDFIANNHPDEIRYNVHQSLQYLADWLSGNGCVALPTKIDGIPVRVMDDLATAERSRWEVWAELRHGRFRLDEFIKIVHEEMTFIRRNVMNERTAKWYPVALKIMLKLMTDRKPAEFATELLMPFTVPEARKNPSAASIVLDSKVEALNHYFEICGSLRFAREMAKNPIEDVNLAEQIIRSFTVPEIIEAASFHGDIGQSKKTLDAQAASEQALVDRDEEPLKAELRSQGDVYLKKFGFKFLISAKGKSGKELLSELNRRLGESLENEKTAAREALWEISKKRMLEHPRAKLNVKSGIEYSIAINTPEHTQCLFPQDRLFEIASLSKTFATHFAMGYFAEKEISLDASVNSIFVKTKSSYRLPSDAVTLKQLMNHSALNMHYVKGFESGKTFPPILDLISGKQGYEAIRVLGEPGKKFNYSGGGFLVLEHLLESLENDTIQNILRPYLDKMGLNRTTFDHAAPAKQSLNFPALAAGGFSTAHDVAHFLRHLTDEFQEGQDVAVQMLRDYDQRTTENGSDAFMGCKMGIGVFIAEAGENRLAIHQGANEGFRALFVQCFMGPDAGKGFVVLATGDNETVPVIADIAQQILKTLRVQGIDYGKLGRSFESRGITQEQVVNQGYKTLLFDAFLPDLPEEISPKGPLDPWAKHNLAVGAKIIACTDQKFARAENLISAYLPTFDPELFGTQGKIMDSWESIRHNPNEYDELELELSKPSAFRYVSFSTQFHDGNHPDFVSLRGFDGNQWLEILPKTKLQGHALLQLDLGKATNVCKKIKVRMYPDGGLSRLGLYESEPEGFKSGESIRFKPEIPKTHKPLSIPFEGKLKVKATNEHYGPAKQAVSPYPAINMFDGLESARSRVPGHFEEAVITLEKEATLERIVLDFKFFVNNNPLCVSIDGLDGKNWVEIAPKTRVKTFAANKKTFHVKLKQKFKEIRVRTYPDGGINRIRFY